MRSISLSLLLALPWAFARAASAEPALASLEPKTLAALSPAERTGLDLRLRRSSRSGLDAPWSADVR